MGSLEIKFESPVDGAPDPDQPIIACGGDPFGLRVKHNAIDRAAVAGTLGDLLLRSDVPHHDHICGTAGEQPLAVGRKGGAITFFGADLFEPLSRSSVHHVEVVVLLAVVAVDRSHESAI